MKILFFLLTILISSSAFSLTRPELEQLLRGKGVDLLEMEIKGAKVLMGEVTGHRQAIPFVKVQILVTENEAVLKQEIDSVEFNGAKTLGGVVSVRFNGQYILKDEVKATIVLE